MAALTPSRAGLRHGAALQGHSFSRGYRCSGRSAATFPPLVLLTRLWAAQPPPASVHCGLHARRCPGRAPGPGEGLCVAASAPCVAASARCVWEGFDKGVPGVHSRRAMPVHQTAALRRSIDAGRHGLPGVLQAPLRRPAVLQLLLLLGSVGAGGFLRHRPRQRDVGAWEGGMERVLGQERGRSISRASWLLSRTRAGQPQGCSDGSCCASRMATQPIRPPRL